MKYLILILGFFILSGCSINISVGDKGTGSIADVTRHLNSRVGKVRDVELINTVFYAAHTYQDSFQWFDGNTLWQGKEVNVPDLEIKSYRAFSDDLNSYVFVIWNTTRNSKAYTMVPNYDIEDEKKMAIEVVARCRELFSSFEVVYQKFYQQSTELDEVYQLSVDYLELHGIEATSQTPLWLLVKIDGTLDDLRKVKTELSELMNNLTVYGVSLEVTTKDGVVTFYKGGEPLLSTEHGGQTYFN